MSNVIAELVAARGAALLDRKSPGWANDIDVETLDLGDPFSCVLGQLYESFTPGLEALFGGEASVSKAIAFGFDSSNSSAGYPALTRAWESEIAARRGV